MLNVMPVVFGVAREQALSGAGYFRREKHVVLGTKKGPANVFRKATIARKFG